MGALRPAMRPHFMLAQTGSSSRKPEALGDIPAAAPYGPLQRARSKRRLDDHRMDSVSCFPARELSCRSSHDDEADDL